MACGCFARSKACFVYLPGCQGSLPLSSLLHQLVIIRLAKSRMQRGR